MDAPEADHLDFFPQVEDAQLAPDSIPIQEHQGLRTDIPLHMNGTLGEEERGEGQKRREKVPSACHPCRQRRIRCSGTRPVCERCLQRNIEAECNYDVRPRMRGKGIKTLLAELERIPDESGQAPVKLPKEWEERCINQLRERKRLKIEGGNPVIVNGEIVWFDEEGDAEQMSMKLRENGAVILPQEFFTGGDMPVAKRELETAQRGVWTMQGTKSTVHRGGQNPQGCAAAA
ncbi:hypothetical protein BT69DRAFT_756443 [Atractiella rhizophila]|nr:hypothetical protein BT69DRAFT_756443 [Atractiella rhizophila]